MTEEEAKAFLKVSGGTLYRWQLQGSLPVYKLGRQRRYRIEDLEALYELWAPEDEEEADQ